jgi:hypothetical protein
VAAEKLSQGKGAYTSVGVEYPKRSTGRRLALARWIVSRKNPLAARVAVNDMWMHHFGEPLVESVADFGLRSPRPLHADLLDWLAAEFMENGWSMKHLHRLMMTSQAYCRASSSDQVEMAENQRIDAENSTYWRANVQRVDAEVMRDSLLAVSGLLKTETGGPDLSPEEGETNFRRSLYFRHANDKQMSMLLIFDAANPSECYRRSPSIVPQQALVLVNSQLARRAAITLESELGNSHAGDLPDADFIRAAFGAVLTRFPTETELQVCQDFLRRQNANRAVATEVTGTLAPKDSGAARGSHPARVQLIHVLLNHNDFVAVR